MEGQTDRLDSEEKQLLSVLRTDPEVEAASQLACTQLACTYVPMTREQKADRLEQWLASASESRIGGLVAFTRGLHSRSPAGLRCRASRPH